MNISSVQIEDWGDTKRYFGPWDYVVFVLMLLASAAIGLYYALTGKKNADAETELLMGGRNMKVFPIAVSLVASFISGISLLGNPTEAYLFGIQYFFVVISMFIIVYPGAYVFLPVFHDLKLSSTYEYLERRFGRKLRYFGSVLFTLGLTSWLPIVIYVPALAFNHVTGMNIHIITPCVCIVCIFYTAVGGLKAVVWTDVIQTLVMVGAVIVVIVKGSLDSGGFDVVWQRAWDSGRIELPSYRFDFTERHTIWSLLFGGCAFYLPSCILNQNMIQRYLALPTLRHAIKSLWIFIFGISFITLLCGYSGLVVYSFYYDCDPLTTNLIKAKDQLLPLLVTKVLGDYPGMPGLFVAGIFSAALSSLSTGLNSMSAVVLEDFIKPTMKGKLTNRMAEIIIKSVVLIFGAICVGLVFVVEKLGTVLQLSISLGSMTGGPLFGIFCLGILFPWANWKGALYGGISGILGAAFIVLGNQRAMARGSLVYPVKPLSVDGCTYFNNFTVVSPNEIKNDDDLFPLYKISYLWYTVCGTCITIITGLIISFATGPTDLSKLDPMYVSPVIRKYLPGKGVKENVPEAVKMLDSEKADEKTLDKV